MFKDVEGKIKNKNSILFSRDSSSLEELRLMIMKQSHLTLVLWAFDNIKSMVVELSKKYTDEDVFIMAYEKCIAWAHGDVKMPVAKKSILDCHLFAKSMDDPYDIALCHAVGQGCSTIHVETHALGMVFYELTAIVIKNGYKDYEVEITDKINQYISKLKFWIENERYYRENREWADFLVKPGKINKEKLLYEKESI